MFSKLTDEGKELKTTFTQEENLVPGVFTTDADNILRWITKCIIELERDKVEKDSAIYKKFAKGLSSPKSITLDEFNDLISILEIYNEKKQESTNYDPNDPLVYI